MASKRDGQSSPISPVLFLNVSGEPMRFFLRPGPTKVELLPIINAGGGLLCRAQESNAILLADPKDMSPAMASTAHFYISTTYIRDCVEKNEQLELEDYRFTEHVQTRSSRQKREGSGSVGRMGYKPEEDSAILNFMSKRKGETRGNLVWKEMEKQGLIDRSWQSMKARYLKLCLDEKVERQTITPKKHPQRSRSHKQSTSPGPLPDSDGSTSNAELDLKSEPEEVSEPDLSEPEPVSKPVSEPEPVSEPDLSEPVSEPQPVSEPHLSEPELHLEPEAVKAEPDQSSEPDVLEPELGQSSEEEVLEPAQAPEPEVLEPEPGQSSEPEVPEPKKAPETEVRKPASDIPKTLTKEDLPPTASDTTDLSLSPEALPSFQPEGAPERVDSSPEGQQKASKQRRRSGTSSITPESKKARAASPSAEENPELNEAGPSGENSVPFIHKRTEPQKKKTVKRRSLGILEKASREFDDGSSGESDDECLDMEVGSAASPPKPGKTVNPAPAPAPASITQTHTPDTETAAVPQPQPKPKLKGKMPKGKRPEAQGPCQADLPEVPGPGPGQREPVPSTSAAHMFLFDNESQEVESSQPIRDEMAFTQVQVEEAKRSIRGLMEETNQDLVAVTKALIKFSGDLSAALIYLNNGTGAGPIWESCDDQLLKSTDLSELRLKYGDKTVARRLAYLDME